MRMKNGNKDRYSQYFTIRGTTPSLGMGKALTGSEWKTLTENRGSLADLFPHENASSSTGDFRFRGRSPASPSLSNALENRSLTAEIGFLGDIFTTSSGRHAGCRFGVTVFRVTNLPGDRLSKPDGEEGLCRRSCSILIVVAMTPVMIVRSC